MTPQKGFVYIVGAGPGDPELITIRGLRIVRTADVILHDRLVHPDLLAEARKGAQIIDVGKRAGWEDAQQEFIHQAMISEARRGRSVCRLKGGDPFVFGRGSEETAALMQAGISFEVIPGVSSSIAAPEIAGIALTHRDSAHGFMVLTGSKSLDLASPEWLAAGSLLQSGGSVVVMMALARAVPITESLIERGCSTGIPAAVISRASLPDQQTRFGTLESISQQVNGLPTPALLVLGQAVATAHGWQGMENSGLRKEPVDRNMCGASLKHCSF